MATPSAKPPPADQASLPRSRNDEKPGAEPVEAAAKPPLPSDPGADLPRALGRYVLLRRIARGGMGEVFLASTTGLEGAERPVVVKIIRREHATDPSFIARFLDEARVQAQLTHSGVAQVLEAAIDSATGEPYAVVEHVEGRSLGDVRARALAVGHRMAWHEAVAIATMIAEALAHVHERQDAAGRALCIVHRDLSPQNVMVGYGGEIKIIDFGTARGQNRRCHTVAGVVFAKPGYVAPEVANGDPGDARVDLYALGVMLWELCAGRRFLQGEAQEHMAKVARNQHSLPPIAASVSAPIELDGIVAKLTAFDRDARYLASRTAGCDLARLLSTAPPLPTGERGVRARAAHLMSSMFPGEPQKSRREFARLVATARAQRALNADRMPPPLPSADAARREAEEEGMLPGTRYQLRRELGRGSSSTVYEAEHVDLGRRVAIKVLDKSEVRTEEDLERFRHEARTLERLSHEGLVRVHDFGNGLDGRLYCAMELLEGETLETYLGRQRGCDWREALGIADKVLSALEVAHGAGLVHCDIKPANLFLTLSGEVKLLDFGIARHQVEASSREALGNAALGSMTLFGTPEYMAPEQAASGQIDHRADLYALGCVLYEMLTGRIPFAEPSAVAILDAKMRGSPERPRERAPARAIPECVDELTMRALARHPSVRFQAAREMREALLTCLEAPARRRAHRRAVGFTALAGLMAFAAVLFVGKMRNALDPPAEVVPPAAAEAPAQNAEASEAPPSQVAADEENPAAEEEDGDEFVDDTPEAVAQADAEAEQSAGEAAPLAHAAKAPAKSGRARAGQHDPADVRGGRAERAKKDEKNQKKADAKAKPAEATAAASAAPRAPAASANPAVAGVADKAVTAATAAPSAGPSEGGEQPVPTRSEVAAAPAAPAAKPAAGPQGTDAASAPTDGPKDGPPLRGDAETASTDEPQEVARDLRPSTQRGKPAQAKPSKKAGPRRKPKSKRANK